MMALTSRSARTFAIALYFLLPAASAPRAIVPSINSRWEIQEVPTPEPGPGQVLIKIHASGVATPTSIRREASCPVRFRARLVMSLHFASPDKDRLIRELGADAVVRDGESLGSAGGADVVLGTSNSADATADAIKGLRPDGRLVVMGFEPKPLPLSIGDLIMRRIRVLGSQQNSREYLYEALKFVAEGKVKVLAETYALTDIARAYDRVEAGQVRFRAVVTG